MIGLFCFVLAVLASLANNDRWFLIQLYRWFPSILKVLTIIRPATMQAGLSRPKLRAEGLPQR
jgi:hypothetical protein